MLTGAAVECAYYQCTRLRVLRAPGFPCSLLFWRDNVRATLGRSAPREGGDVWCILSRGTSFETALSRLLTMRFGDPHGEERGNTARLEPCGPLEARS
jgi:hypothetical protein